MEYMATSSCFAHPLLEALMSEDRSHKLKSCLLVGLPTPCVWKPWGPASGEKGSKGGPYQC